jgi:hypothetical protein
MLSELQKRKPDLAEHDSVRVTFADGQGWLIPTPWLVFHPVFENGVATHCYRSLGYGAPIDDLVAMIAGLDDFDVIASASATLAGCLLRLQYNLTDDELDQLLAIRADDVESSAWMTTVVEIATGHYGRRVGSEVRDAG